MSRSVVCSNCGQHVFDVDASPGQEMLPAHLTPVHPDVQRPTPGEAIVCPLCGSPGFFQDLQNSVLR